MLENLVAVGNDLLWTYVLIAMLIFVGLYFTYKTKFIQIRQLGEMIRLLREGVGESVNGGKGVSAFGAFALSTASRVGTGNLAGVSLAISIGGPGAVFWMWLIALIGSASAFVEATLAQVYKVKDQGGFRGGPAYYMEKGLNKRWMGIIFAILITASFGLVFNAVQANTITLAVENAYGIDRLVTGIFLAAVTAYIIFGGVKRIVAISEWLVPIMAGGYLLIAGYVMIVNFSELPAAITLIVKSAFGLEQAFGGGMGAAMLMGIKRGLFSNEAGMGSAPNAAATADVSHPVKQGLIQALGVFVDTLLICSATAFIVLLSGSYQTEGLEGIQLLQVALSSQVGSWAMSFVAIAVLLFAFTSVVGNYYYGQTNIEFIHSNKKWIFVYRLAVVGMTLFGSIAKVSIVWDLADLFMALMALTNLIAILLLGKIAIAALEDYLQQRKQGADPVFKASCIAGLNNAECWEKEQDAKKEERIS